MSKIGRVLGERWQLLAPVGGGAMGTVWRARDVSGGPDVAVKLMARATRGLAALEERFSREAMTSATVRHPNVVTILDHGTTSDREPYLVMELLRGESLGARIERPEPLAAHEVLTWGLGLLDGLEAVHAAGIVHRDLKPDNVFLADQPDGSIVVKVLDFGVSLAGAADWDLLTRSGEVLGTVGYIAPEQRSSAHDVDARADLYSAGAVLYEALAGLPAFGGRNIAEVLVAAREARVQPLEERAPELGKTLSDVIARALAHSPDGRYPSARAMRDALAAAIPTVPRDARCTMSEVARSIAKREARAAAAAVDATRDPERNEPPGAATLGPASAGGPAATPRDSTPPPSSRVAAEITASTPAVGPLDVPGLAASTRPREGAWRTRLVIAAFGVVVALVVGIVLARP